MGDVKRTVRSNFEASAAAYEAYANTSDRFDDLAVRLTRTLAGMLDDDVGGGCCLDAGAGTGASTHVLAERFGQVIALDASRRMLESAPEPRVVGDFDRLPFRDGTFDAVAYTASLFLTPEPAVALSEARRVLRPGGVVGAVAPRGWTVGGEDAFAGLSRRPRSPATAETVVSAFETTFETVERGEWALPSSPDDLRAFHAVPAMAARLYPSLPPTERVEAATELLSDVDGEVEQRWVWVVSEERAKRVPRSKRAGGA